MKKLEFYVVSDTHFGDFNVLRQQPGKTLDQLNDMIIEQWNEVISPTDNVIHLGDFTGQIGESGIKGGYEENDRVIKYYKAIMDRLNGVKVLRKGNHDKHGNEFYYRIGFTTVSGEDIIAPGIRMSHKPLQDRKNNLNICGHIHDSLIRTLLHNTYGYFDVAWKHSKTTGNIHKVTITDDEIIIDGDVYSTSVAIC